MERMSSYRLQPYVQGHVLIPLPTLLKQDTRNGFKNKGEQCYHGKTYKADGRLKRLWTLGITVIFEDLIKLSSPGQDNLGKVC